jgi:choline dehydrogenase-like flavoprotein
MKEPQAGLSEPQLATLRLLCDTVVPAIERKPDPEGFWARKATDLDADVALADLLSTLPPDQREGIGQLLDELEEQGFGRISTRSREQMLRNFALAGPEVAAGVAALVNGALFMTYGLPDPQTGQNPMWRTFGYPGPISAPPQVPRSLDPMVPDADELQLEADAVVIGSGAGGGVIAGTLATNGLHVVVLEAGAYFDCADFNMLELWAFQNLYYRGGPTPTADLNVSMQAGFTVGGGTTVNWTNCLRTRPWVREQWAREFGLEGVDGPEFDRHMDAVMERIGANEQCSDYNGPTLRMKEGAERLGWSFERVIRNADPATYTPESAGYLGFGDQTGSKQSTARTYLRDLAEAGGVILARTTAERILVDAGRASGVEATYADPETGHSAAVTVQAPVVVVACGSLESPALLLRSGIGGPAVGDNLHLHPCTALFGYYGEDQRSWWGPCHTGVVDEFANVEDGYGFLIETAQYTTGLGASALPFTDARRHKELMHDYARGATFIGLLRDRGAGQVTIDADGNAVHHYSLSDELDVRNTHRAIGAQARLHEAAGAEKIYALAAGMPHWRRGEDLEGFISHAQRIPLAAGGYKLFSAHQMGSCRMGTDPRTSVAGPWGELHDTPGIWIGDGSAMPTASGTNPMISIMALAHRTAEAVAAAAPSAVETRQTTPTPTS